MSVAYLQPTEIIPALRTNGAVEQWLGHRNEDGYRALEWIRIETIDDGRATVSRFDVFDDGNHDFVDIYEFEPIDPENPFGAIAEFDSIDEALQYALSEWHAEPHRFVRGGDIQLIYADFLGEMGLPPA